MMIKKGARIEDGVNVFELLEDNYCNWDTVIRLLNIYPQYVNYRDRDGATLLTNHGTNPKIIKKLLSLGADPTILSIDDRGPLTITCMRGDIESVKMLIQAGADPLSYTSLDLYRLMESSKWISFLRYLLKLPQLKDRNMPENLALFYIMLIIQLAKHHQWRGRESKVKKTLQILMKRNPSVTNIKSVNCKLVNSNIIIPNLLSHIVLKSELALENIYIFITLLLKFNFTNIQIPANQITPLTALMISYKSIKPICAYDNVLFQLFINKGVDLNSYALNNYPDLIKTNNVYNHLELHIKVHYGIPDVLFLAVRYRISDIVWRMLEHWWGPPLLLVTVFPRNEGIPTEENLYSRWFPMLLEYGGVPHGIPMFMYYEATIKFWIQNADNSEYYTRYRPVLNKCFQTMSKYNFIILFSNFHLISNSYLFLVTAMT
jgi:ankyrin repeat protein